jgi:hypothetical protein
VTPIAAYIALASFPVLANLRPEPIGIRWAVRHGKLRLPMPPLPPELWERSQRNRRYLLFLTYALVCACAYVAMREYSIPASAAGLHLRHWPIFIGVGVAASVVRLGFQSLMRAIAGTLAAGTIAYHPADYLTRGSPVLWVASDLVGSFAQEYWRAFCLVALLGLHSGVLSAVVATSVAFCLAHYHTRTSAAAQFGYLLTMAGVGVFYALLFLWSHSIVVTCTAHLLGNLVGLYRARKALTARDSAPGDRERARSERLACPVCHRRLARADVSLDEWFRCPACRTALRVSVWYRNGLLFASCVIGPLVAYGVGIKGLWLIVAWAPFSVLVLAPLAILARLLVPPRIKRHLSGYSGPLGLGHQ